LDPERLRKARGAASGGFNVTQIMPADKMNSWLSEAKAPILTDDYAPTDNLIAPIFADRG
jgi:hypothetical protein